MERIIQKSLCLVLICFGVTFISAQSIEGVWKSIDDTDNVEKSHIKIYEKDGLFYGQVIKLLEGATLQNCEACEGDKKDQPITGMVILEGMATYKDYWKGGTILDPATGKTYKCYIELEESNKLKLRGFIGLPAFGRTQYWYRAE